MKPLGPKRILALQKPAGYDKKATILPGPRNWQMQGTKKSWDVKFFTQLSGLSDPVY
jgi:hypothetical protein